MDVDLLGWWLAERQLPAGGFNGRPEKVLTPRSQNATLPALHNIPFPTKPPLNNIALPKFRLCFNQLPDVCYSWWVLTSMRILGRSEWIDADQLKKFILACTATSTLF